MDIKDRNMISYAMTSVVLQIFIAFIMQMAIFGTNVSADQIYDNSFGPIADSQGKFVTYDNSSQMNEVQGRETNFDIIQSAVASIGAVIKTTGVMGYTLATFVGLSIAVSMAVGGGIMGAILALAVVVWQVQCGIIILKFIMPSRMKGS